MDEKAFRICQRSGHSYIYPTFHEDLDMSVSRSFHATRQNLLLLVLEFLHPIRRATSVSFCVYPMEEEAP